MKHCIIVKWTAEAKAQTDLTDRVREHFSACTSVPGVRGVQLLPNIIARPNRYDLAIELDMAPEALPAWDASEVHAQWKARFGALIEAKTIIDLE